MANKGPPIDRGWAWVIVAGLFMKSVISGGLIKSYGIFFAAFTDTFTRPASETQLVKSVMSASFTLTGPFGTALSERFSERVVVIAGALTMSTGLVLSFFANSLEMIIFTFGMFIGIGDSLVNGPARVCLGRYFDKRRGRANSITLVGTAVGQMAIPPIVTLLMSAYSLRGTMLIYGGLCLNIIIAGAFMRPLKSYFVKDKSKTKKNLSGIENPDCSVDGQKVVNNGEFPGMNNTASAVNVCNDHVSEQTRNQPDNNVQNRADDAGTNLSPHSAGQYESKEGLVESSQQSSTPNTSSDASFGKDPEIESKAKAPSTKPTAKTQTGEQDTKSSNRNKQQKSSDDQYFDTNGEVALPHLTTTSDADEEPRILANISHEEIHTPNSPVSQNLTVFTTENSEQQLNIHDVNANGIVPRSKSFESDLEQISRLQIRNSSSNKRKQRFEKDHLEKQEMRNLEQSVGTGVDDDNYIGVTFSSLAMDNKAYVSDSEESLSEVNKNCNLAKLKKQDIEKFARPSANVTNDAGYLDKSEILQAKSCSRSRHTSTVEEERSKQLTDTQRSNGKLNSEIQHSPPLPDCDMSNRSRTSSMTKSLCSESICVKQNGETGVEKPEQVEVPVPKKKESVCKKVLTFFKSIFDRRVLLNPLYILFLICTSIRASAVVNQTIFIVPRAEEVGISREMAAILLSVVGGCDVAGRILLGLIADVEILRQHPYLVMAAGLFVTSACMIVFPFATSFEEMVAVVVVFGLCGSTHVVLNLPVMVDIVGEVLLAKAVGLSILFIGTFSAVLAPLLGLVKDESGSFSMIFYVTAAMEIFVAILLVAMELLSSRRRKTVKLV